MSQSDYLQHKRASAILKSESMANADDLEAVLKSSDYTKFKQYTIINTIKNAKTTQNQLLDTNKHRVFNMEKNVNNCPDIFVVCKNTDSRYNRKPNAENVLFRGYKHQIPTYEFFLKRKLKTKYSTEKELEDYQPLEHCEVFEECEKYFFLRDERPYDTDDEITVYIG